MQTSNPVLHTFEKPQTWDQLGTLDARAHKLGVMTMSGTINATALLLGICVAVAFVTWAFIAPNLAVNQLMLLGIGGAIGGLILTFVIVFNPKRAMMFSIPAAACEGLFVGAVSMLYAAWIGSMQTADTSGASVNMLAGAGSYLIVQAVLLTFGVFGAMLLVYSTRTIRATPALIKGIMAATFGVVFLMVGRLLLGLFMPIPSLAEMGWLGIAIAGVVVVVAAFNLIIDFHVIEEGVKKQAPKHMEWFAAFGLMITLVWLYVSLLRLLALIAASRR